MRGIFLVVIFGCLIFMGLLVNSMEKRLSSIDAHLARLVQVQEASLRELRKGVRAEVDWSLPVDLPPVVAEKGE